MAEDNTTWRRHEMLEMAGEVAMGVKWTGMLLNACVCRRERY